MNQAFRPPPEGLGHHHPGAGQPPADGEGDSLDLRARWRLVWRRRRLVGLTTALALALALLFVLETEPRFTARARVLFDPERLQIIDLQEVIVNRDVAGIGLQNQVEILRSEALLERVVAMLRLEDAPAFDPGLRSPTLLDRLAARAGIPPKLGLWLAGLGLGAPTTGEPPTPEEAAERRRAGLVQTLRAGLVLRPVPNSRVIEVAYTATDPGLAAAVVNTITDQYILLQVEGKRDDVAAATELLSVRVRDLENRLNASEEAVAVARLDLSIAAGQSAEMTRQQLEVLNAALTGARVARADLARRHARVAAALGDGAGFETVSEFRDSPVIRSLTVSESELAGEKVSLQSIVGADGNPNLTRLDARLAEVRRSIRTEAGNIVAALARDLAAAEETEVALAAEVRALETRMLEQSRAELRLQQLEREAGANRSIYESFLNRMKETSEQASMQTSDVRILARAGKPDRPDTASRQRIVALAGAGGLLAGIALAHLLERLSNTFRTPAELEARTGLPVLAAIPRAGFRRRPRALIDDLVARPSSALAESIRSLRTSILCSSPDRPPRVVMFTSSVPAEGKTTTALLTAITSTQMGRSAIIVDCDIRRRTLAGTLAADASQPGLFAVLAGAATVEAAVIREPTSGLHALVAEAGGHTDVNPADVVGSARFRELLDELRARYDLIILDTPPTLVVTDARIVAQLADAVVYLVQWDRTRRGAVVEGLRELGLVKARVAGVALTLVDEARSAEHADAEYRYRRRYRQYIAS